MIKARHEFETDAAYQQYLTVCYAGLAMSGLLCLPHSEDQSPEEFTPEKVAEFRSRPRKLW
jgi:hypothetical protein